MWRVNHTLSVIENKLNDFFLNEMWLTVKVFLCVQKEPVIAAISFTLKQTILFVYILK